ncbi:MAG: hypothetical protein GWM98_17200, partial [Nitrospinaceae bacterium]|nr:hypothetical protein [Nitrospinaceae bacterium]NIR55908.1 hypothetical protein [Nitrospinaceae bacterium]NIS86355.1 hypothetical protein [Nitrospinaceae bacterium]NIT83191.1 hypothetical protein [Nitrospinaceae bacterium]NIU45402.1 hypothetical protein [Nitrospinaceae bacterium]
RGKPPLLELKQEKNVQNFCLEVIREGLIHSAHDCSEGGLGVAAAEACISGPGEAPGAVLNLE